MMFTVTFFDEDKTTQLDQKTELLTGETITAADIVTPTKAADATYKYTFDHWADAEGNEIAMPITVTGETFCKLGKNMEDYAYLNMWAGPPTYNGTYDVEDSITGMIRTDGPVISFNGAWAQNINHNEMYIDFMGDKGGIRLTYLGDFTYYSFSHGALEEFKPSLRQDEGSFQKEINAFLRCTETGEKLPSHIDNVVVTAQIMQAIYDSADSHREITL